MARQNAKLYVRGRFVRDPRVVDAKDDSGRKFVLGRLAVDQPYIDPRGDTKSSTLYVELKAYDPALVQALLDGDVRLGTLIEATGSVRLERSEYEKDGEKRESHSIAVILDDPEHHSVAIEAHAKATA